MRYQKFGLAVFASILTVIVTVGPSRSHDTTACNEADPEKAKIECHPAKVSHPTKVKQTTHYVPRWDWRKNWGKPGPPHPCPPSPIKNLSCKGGADYLPYQHPSDGDGPWWVFHYEGD